MVMMVMMVMAAMWLTVVSSDVSFDQLHRQLDGGFFSRERSRDDGSGGAWGGDVGEVFGVVGRG